MVVALLGVSSNIFAFFFKGVRQCRSLWLLSLSMGLGCLGVALLDSGTGFIGEEVVVSSQTLKGADGVDMDEAQLKLGSSPVFCQPRAAGLTPAKS
jgi:hypothetical protein